MTHAQIVTQVNNEKKIGFRYQQQGHRQFRDRITIYRDNKILFERFCYGESAGLVFEMWAPKGANENGEITWDYDACPNSRKTDAPKQITGGDINLLQLDNKQILWECTEKLKKDSQHGYGGLKSIFSFLK